MLSRRLVTIAAAALAAPLLAAGPAAAAWLPVAYAGLELQARLGVVDGHQSRAEAITTADQVCTVLRANPNSTGKATALELVEAAGYLDPFARGWALGVMADVRCYDAVPALLGYR